MTPSAYSFGDSHRAAIRLKKVADVFSSEMRRFLEASAPKFPAVAVDVGCGPGYTTRLLGEVTQARNLWGLDFSEQFIAIASENNPGPTQFLRHDVTSGPLPVQQAEIIFCHLLLTHLGDPLDALAVWSQSLTQGGVILADETEAIQTKDPVLSDYLALVEVAVSSRGGDLYIGRKLANLTSVPGLAVRSNGTVAHQVSMTVAASMFSLNLETLRDDSAVRRAFDDRALDRIAKELAVRKDSTGSGWVTWTMRQMVFEAM